MSLPTIAPREGKEILEKGAILIDIREPDEHAREKIAASKNVPLSRLETETISNEGRPILFVCRSGARTLSNASRLAAKADVNCAYIVEGGLDGWKKAGLPVVRNRNRPLELQRQVQIAAGGLAVVGTLLGLLVSPWFLAVPLFVGGGLMTAGISGFCGMARLLVRLPWNRAVQGGNQPAR